MNWREPDPSMARLQLAALVLLGGLCMTQAFTPSTSAHFKSRFSRTLSAEIVRSVGSLRPAHWHLAMHEVGAVLSANVVATKVWIVPKVWTRKYGHRWPWHLCQLETASQPRRNRVKPAHTIILCYGRVVQWVRCSHWLFVGGAVGRHGSPS